MKWSVRRKKRAALLEGEKEKNPLRGLSVKKIVSETGEHFHGILRANLYEMNLKKEEVENLMHRKQELRRQLKNCGIGNEGAKEYVKDIIKEMLTEKYRLTEENIDFLYPFEIQQIGRAQEKFTLLLYAYKMRYGNRGLEHMILDNRLIEERDEVFKISGKSIELLYEQEMPVFSYLDKLEIVAQKIYEAYKGLGVIDEIRDMRIDGVSGGVSGMGIEERSVWIFFQGKSIYLPFLSFGSKRELERICRNICRFEQPGQLSQTRGYIVNEMADHSRIVVARPPFCENWVFFVRKFDSLEHKEIEQLIKEEGAELVIQTLKWIVKGCQVFGITGAQGSGKTTLLMSLIEYIPPSFTLRIVEMAFELHLRQLYPERNIVTFRETDRIGGQEGLDLQKKTDGTVTVIGEVATAKVASWMIESGQTGSLFTMFTHHAKTTKSLINTLRNSLLSDGNFQNEAIAKQQVTEVVRYDIHMTKEKNGHRHIERITEIVPEWDNPSNQDFYRENVLISYEEGRYVFRNLFSESGREEIKNHLTSAERKEFMDEYVVPLLS